jgi:DNA-binding NtrC family response regulator
MAHGVHGVARLMTAPRRARMFDDACSTANGHILVVDDDVELCELFSLRAGANGYQVTATPGVVPTLEKLAHEHFDLILLDLDLGPDHGFELLDAVVATKPHIPIIVLTASGTAGAEAEAERRGAADFVTKPFHHHDLLRRIARAVGEARARSEARSVPSG